MGHQMAISGPSSSSGSSQRKATQPLPSSPLQQPHSTQYNIAAPLPRRAPRHAIPNLTRDGRSVQVAFFGRGGQGYFAQPSPWPGASPPFLAVPRCERDSDRLRAFGLSRCSSHVWRPALRFLIASDASTPVEFGEERSPQFDEFVPWVFQHREDCLAVIGSECDSSVSATSCADAASLGAAKESNRASLGLPAAINSSARLRWCRRPRRMFRSRQSDVYDRPLALRQADLRARAPPPAPHPWPVDPASSPSADAARVPRRDGAIIAAT